MLRAKYTFKDEHGHKHHMSVDVHEDSTENMLLQTGKGISESHVQWENGNHPYETLISILVKPIPPKRVVTKKTEPVADLADLNLTPEDIIRAMAADIPERTLEELMREAAEKQTAMMGTETAVPSEPKGETLEPPIEPAADAAAEPTPETKVDKSPRVQNLPVTGRQIQVQKPETVAKKTNLYFEKQGHDLKAFDKTLNLIVFEDAIYMSPATYAGKSIKREFYHDLLLKFFGSDQWSLAMFLQFEKVSRFFEKGERGRLKKLFRRLQQLNGMQEIIATAKDQRQSLETVTITIQKMIPIPDDVASTPS